MAKVVAPGHLRFKDDEKLDLHPKKAVLNVNSKKIFKIYQKKGIVCRTQKAPNHLTNKTPPPQTESSSTINSSPKDIDIDDEEFPWNECDHRTCYMLELGQEEDAHEKYDLDFLENGLPTWQLKVPHSPKPLTKLDCHAFEQWIPDKMPSPPSFPDDPYRDYPTFQGLPDPDDDDFPSIPHMGENSDDSLDEEIDD